MGGSRGLIVESRIHNQKVVSLSLRSGRDCRCRGVNVQRSLHLQYHDKVLLSKTPNPQLLAGCVFTVCVCSLLCVHFNG